MSTTIIADSIEWELLEKDLEDYSPNELKYHLLNIFVKLKNVYGNVKSEELETKKRKVCLTWVKANLITAEACIDRIWEMLNSGYWKDVPINYRYCYSLASILKSVLLEISSEITDELKFKEIIEQIDKAILLGAPLPRNPHVLPDIASKLNNYFLKLTKEDENLIDNIKIKDEYLFTLFPGFSSIPCFTKPSMETFYCNIFKPKVPALLEGCLNHWPALHLWQNVKYLEKIAGYRTVPIEIGSKYTEDDWTQKLVTFSNFLETHISKENDKIGYLAQHQLFDQIPELKNDFTIPDYCNFSDKEDNNENPDINAWFGPDGTISPLHYDPKNNLLCQVFGYKRIILYSPSDNENLYPYENRLLCNTARVDPYNPDFENFPNFQKSKGLMCFLKPGDMLFIPPKWWHHVVALSASFSISFWWD